MSIVEVGWDDKIRSGMVLPIVEVGSYANNRSDNRSGMMFPILGDGRWIA
jgi:hypothetical protein